MRALPLGTPTLRSYFYPQDSWCKSRLLTCEEEVETPQPLLPKSSSSNLTPMSQGQTLPRPHLEFVNSLTVQCWGLDPNFPERIITSCTLSSPTSPPRVLFGEAGVELSSPRSSFQQLKILQGSPPGRLFADCMRFPRAGDLQWAGWRWEATMARTVSLGPSLSLSPDHHAHLHPSSSDCFE